MLLNKIGIGSQSRGSKVTLEKNFNCSHLFSYDCVQTISLLEKKLIMNSTELTCDNFKPSEAYSVIKTRTFFEQKNFFFWNSIF